MSDRELLELAAKAAGIEGCYTFSAGGKKGSGFPYDREGIVSKNSGGAFWNPLYSDGDAFRLAVNLRIDIEHNEAAEQQRWVCASRRGCEGCFAPVSVIKEDFDESGRAAATRRTIVRAAAEIGKAQNGQ